ncbi:putative transmembrane protein [Toxoplasma gondii TgCatPRC2]|uniref:Putative transmembrane protein n=1 Tax=Toxoplasma gondii TgCatPRC2 TaxID=1130821 RepID=A0A151H2V4_TOXGO|nr:putative transmembrane protein [Toxoplasma gondii TgCatPRC2]
MRRRVPRLQAWRVLSSVATQRSTLAISVFDSRFCRSCVRVFLVLDIKPCAVSLYSKCSAGRRFGTLSKSQTFDVVPSVQPAHAHASHAYIYIYIYIYIYTYVYIYIYIHRNMHLAIYIDRYPSLFTCASASQGAHVCL